MEKTSTLNLRVNPTLKSNAESILSELGIPMSVAVDMFLKQIVLVGGIPFQVTLPQASKEIDVSQMSEEEFHNKLDKGYNDYKDGKTQNAREVFSNFREKHIR